VLLHFFNERELSFDVSEALTQLLLLNDIKVNDTFVTGLSKRPRLRPSLQTAIENLNQTSADFDLATVLRILKEWGTKRFRLNLFTDRVLMAFDANRLLAFFELFPFVEIADYEMVFAFCPHVPPFFSFFREYHADHLADFTDEWLKIEDYSPEFRALLIACYDQTQNAAFLWKAAVLVGEEPEDEFIGYCQAAIEDTPAELKPLIIQALETDLRHSFWDLLHRLDLSNFSFADCQLPSLDLRQESLAFLLETGYNVPESVVRSLAASEIDFVRHTAIQKGYNLPSDQSPSNDDLFVTILELVATGNYEMGFTQFDAFLQRISDPTAEFLIRLWDFFVGDQAPAIIRRSTTIATLMNLFQHAPRALVTVLSNTRFAETCEIRPNVQSPVLAVAANLRTLLLTETSLLEVFRDFNFSPSPAIAYRCPQEFGELQRRMTPASFAQFHILVHTESRIEPVFEIAALSGKSVSESLAQYVFESPILNTPAILSIFCETLESTDVVLDEYVFLNGVRYRLSSVLNRDGAAFLVVDGVPGFLKYENSSVTRVAAVEGTLSDLFYERYPPLTASELHAFSLGYGGTSVVSKVLHDPAINWSALFSKPEFDQFAPALYAAQRIPQLLSLYQRDRAFAVEFFNDWRGSADNCLDNPAFVAAHGAHVLSLALAHPDPLELGVAILRRCERPDLALQILSRVQTDKHLPIWREACRSDTVLDSPAFSQFALSIFRQAPDPTLLLADTSLTDKLFAALVQTDALLELALSVPAVRAFVIERAPREVLLRALKLPSVGADFALAARPRLADSPDVIYVLEKLGDDALRANPGSVFSLLQGEAHERAFALTLRLWPPDGPADPALRDFLSQADVSQLPSVIARYAAWLTDSLPILRYIWSGAAGPHWETLVEAAAALPRAPDSALSELAAAPHGEGKLWACSVLRIAAVFPNGIGFLSPEAIEGPLASALSLFDAAELEALARPLLARVTDATLPLSFANIALFARFPRLLVPHFPAFAALTRLAPVALLRLLPLCDDGAFVSLTAAVLASNSTADAGAWALPPPELAQRLEKWLPLAAPTTAFFSLVRDSLRVCPECTPAVVAQFCAAPPAVSAELRLTYGQFLLAVWDFIAAPPERIALLGRWLSLIVDVLCQTVAPPRFPLADALPLLAALNRPFFPAFQRRIPGIQPALLNRLCATPELLLLANGEPANPREISAVKRLFTNIRIAKRAPNTDCAGAFVAGIRAGETHKLDLLAFLVRKFDQAFDKRALTAQTGASNARQAILQALLGKRVN
jgi:hypothetical protein